MELSSRRVKYSKSELALFSIIPKSGKEITTNEIVKKRYGSNPPYHGRGCVLAAMRTLASKMEHNGEGLRLCKSERAGPHPISFWLEKCQ